MRLLYLIFAYVIYFLNCSAAPAGKWMTDPSFPNCKIAIEEKAKLEVITEEHPLRVLYRNVAMPTQDIPKLMNARDDIAHHVFRSAILVFSIRGSIQDFQKEAVSLRSYAMALLLTTNYLTHEIIDAQGKAGDRPGQAEGVRPSSATK